jgi:hypothetical protein
LPDWKRDIQDLRNIAAVILCGVNEWLAYYLGKLMGYRKACTTGTMTKRGAGLLMTGLL